MSTLIGVDRRRVWRALTDPNEVVAWDDNVLAAIDASEDYPESGRETRWRVRLGSVQAVLHECHRSVLPLERIDSALTLGSLRLEQTFTLADDSAPDPRTRLSMKLIASNSVPLLGTEINRFEIRRIAAERIDHTLSALQKWCEENP